MSQIRFIYTIQTDGDETPTPVVPQANRILKIDDVGASIMLGDTVRIVRGRDLYIPPEDIAHGLMFGTDRKKLCKAWDTAVKKKAMSILSSYSRYFTAHDDNGGNETPAEPTVSATKAEKNPQESSNTPESSKDIETHTPTILDTPLESKNTQAPDTKTAEPEFIYPHACKIPWDSIETFIPKMVAKWFPSKESQITARFIFGSYAESNEGWTFVLEDVTEEDRLPLTALLAEHDTLHEVSLEAEWPEGEPMGGASFPLTTAISNHILATEFLPFLTPPFTYGVNLAIPNAEGLVVVSNTGST